MLEQIKSLLEQTLPKNTKIIVTERKNCFGGNYIKIGFAVSDLTINQVTGQYVQLVSLSLELDDLTLQTQVYGGSGGGNIYRKPNMEHPREKYQAMARIKIPFRQPKKENKFVLSAIERFAKNWVKAIRENKEILMYQDLVDYDAFLES